MKKHLSLFAVTQTIALAAAFAFLPLTSAQAADQKAEKAAHGKPAKAAKAVKPYPLDVCLVSDEAFGGDMGEPHVLIEDGQEIKLCCKSCLKDFKKDKKALMAKVADANKKVKAYKLDTCAVSGEKFGGDMGEPVVFVYKGQEMKLCCKECMIDFNKDKDGILKKVVAATEKK